MSQRIVSLLPSLTEIACGLDLRDQLVGRSHECDYPASVQSLPICTEPRFDVSGSSAEIDQRVRRLVQDGLSVYRVHTETLRDLAPNLVLTQDQCEVCAASLGDVERALAEWTQRTGPGARPPRVLSLAPETLDDVFDDIRRVGAATAREARAESLVAALRGRMDAIRETSGKQTRRPRVVCLEWLEPLMAAGHWVPELVRRAGGELVLGKPGARAPTLTRSQLADADPDVIIAQPCGFDLARSRAELAALAQTPAWHELRAVREGRVAIVDGNQYLNRPGPRLVESLEILAEILHPETYDFGHRGTGWQLAP